MVVLSVSVDRIKSKEITSIDTTVDTFENVVLLINYNNVSAFISTSPSLNNGDKL